MGESVSSHQTMWRYVSDVLCNYRLETCYYEDVCLNCTPVHV